MKLTHLKLAVRSGGACLAALTTVTMAGAEPADSGGGFRTAGNLVLEEVTVSSTPLGGFEIPVERVPGHVQRATHDSIERVRRAGFAQFMDQKIGSVSINEAQANPLQPDVHIRGFVASPLLGQPQGVAVYQNGVRINDPFGDIVNWALIPEGAIERVDVISGSNPLFGLNALGGALSLQTKTGFSSPGTSVEVLYGSYGRTIAQVESGGESDGRFSYYGNVRYLEEDGWRDHSPTEALHFFGDVGWRGEKSEAHLSVTRITTDLIGNGPTPVQLLAVDREAIYTHPDRTENDLVFATLSLSHRFSDSLQLSAVAYSRRSDIDTLNGDESPFEECEDDPGFVCDDDEEELALDPDGEPIPFGPNVDGAALNRSATRQDTYGVSAQLGAVHFLGGRENRLIVGGAVDQSRTRFGLQTELATFDDTRGAIGSGILAEESFVGLKARTKNWSVFITDTYAITPQLDATVSARYNDTRVELRDQIGTELSGDHSFTRFNRAAGLTYRPSKHFGLYASYGESNRAPSPVELTCADEDDPCSLPNAFLSDPPLEQVVARTIEVGARGAWRHGRWHAGVFRTKNDDDILFISAGQLTNQGFFDNVGETRRQGIELNADGRFGRLSWSASYVRLDAEFRDSFTVMSDHNPMAVDGEIHVPRGARIPSLPKYIAKVGAALDMHSVRLGLDVSHQSDQYFRGDEGNLNPPLSGYTLVNASAEWSVTQNFSLFLQVENLLDEKYATFGLYGAADEVPGMEDADDPRFVSPAARRAAWVGFKFAL
jgi:iron complex outermembrane receptor protein